MATPHNNANPGDIAKTVLMPGDPLRAEFIAKTYLKDVKCYNTVRNMLGFTGYYQGKQVSVQGSGMGIPSIGIYSHELYHVYDVDRIIRIGSAGAYSPDVHVRDLVFGMGACTNSNYAQNFSLPGTFAPIADFALLRAAVQKAEAMKVAYHVGNILSSDTFYEEQSSAEQWSKMGVLAVEMESAGLYMNAARAGKQALCIVTVSDSLVTGEQTTAEERQNSFTQMMKIALSIA